MSGGRLARLSMRPKLPVTLAAEAALRGMVLYDIVPSASRRNWTMLSLQRHGFVEWRLGWRPTELGRRQVKAWGT